MRFEVALLRAEDEGELRALLRLCFGVILSMTVLVALSAGLITATGWPGSAAALPFTIWLIPVALLVGGTAQCMSYLVTRESAFSVSANSKVAQSGAYAAAGTGLGAAAPITSGIILADLFGRFTLASFLLGWAWRRDRRLFAPVGKADILAAASSPSLAASLIRLAAY